MEFKMLMFMIASVALGLTAPFIAAFASAGQRTGLARVRRPRQS